MFKYINYLTIVLLPAYLIKIPLREGVSLNLLDILLVVSISYNLFIIFRKDNFRNFLKIQPRVKIALFLFIFGYSLSFLINFSKNSFLDNIGILKSCLFLPILFSLTVSFLVYKKELCIKYILFSFLFLTSFLSMFGFIYFFLNILTFDNRLEIFFNSPNALSMLLGPGIIILVYFLNKAKGCYYAFLLSLLFFHTFSTIATLSVGCLLSLFFLLVLFIFSKVTSFNFARIYSTFILFVFLISLFLLFLSPLLQKTNYSPNIPPSSFDSRIVIYDVARQIILTDFFPGIGPGNFQKNYLSKQSNNLPYPQWAVPHPHNNLLLIATEGGFFTLLGYFLLIFNKPQIKKMPFGILLVFILFYFLIHGVVDTTIWKNDLSVVFWLILGLLNFYQKPLFK